MSFDIINSPIQGPFEIEIDQLTLLENGQDIQISSFEPVKTGVHFALAVNGGRDFDLRDPNGVSPYQKMATGIIDWASERAFLPEDAWSFVTNDGIVIRNTLSSSGWVTALRNYQPNFRNLESDLASLELSIQMLKDWTVPFGVDKALLYITVPPSADQTESIRTLAQEAVVAGIDITVWMIGDGYFLTNDQGGALIDMASLTGGQFFHYTGTETLPDPEMMLTHLGGYFHLTYESEIRQTGTYPLILTVDTPEGPLSAETISLYIEVSPPKPILLSPPTSISRQAPANAVNPLESLEPHSTTIEFIVEFPDGRPREIVESRLFIDGALAEVNTVPPFVSMTWDLSSITESGDHTIQVEIMDTLGLSSRTIELPLVVKVITPSSTAPETLPRQQTGLLISGAILIAALLILLVWGFRQFWASPRFSALTQRLFTRFKRKTKDRSPGDEYLSAVFATLIPINEIYEDDKEQTLPHLTQTQTYVGSDSFRAGLVLSGKGIDPFHAQIKIKNNSFWINDLDSSGGTWLNYERIGTNPLEVHPGDIIHFGNTGFRFTIIEPSNPPPVHFKPYEPYS